MKNPFLILGNPRSGTSLLRIMMDSHPLIVVPPECGFIEWLYEKYRTWKPNDGFKHFLLDLYETRKFETWKLPKNFLQNELKKSRPQTYQELCQQIYLAYGKYLGANPLIWGDKNNYYIQHLDKILNIFPHASFIHLVRDGRDVAVSYKKINHSKFISKYKPKLPDSITEIAYEWNSNLQRIQHFLDSINKKNSITIRYEDLLTDTSNTLLSISEFLNVKYDDKMTKYYQRNQKLSIEPYETLEWKRKTLENIDSSRIGRFQKNLTPNEIEQFELISHQNLSKYRYI